MKRATYLFNDTLNTAFEAILTLELWCCDPRRDLTLYLEADGTVTYLMTWGACMETEMHDGTVTSWEHLRDLARWLFGHQPTASRGQYTQG